MTEHRYNGPTDADTHLLLAHGAGAGMDHPFMESIATQLGAQGIRVVRFEFPYMAQNRRDGKRRPPDRAPKLLSAFAQFIDDYSNHGPQHRHLLIGGKSMGGRMASLLASAEEQTLPIAGLVCLGFPFHPPGKPERFRGEHLANIATPTLIIQGERDSFGNQSEIHTYPCSRALQWLFLQDGDHSFKPRKASGFTQEQHLSTAAERIATFCQARAQRMT